MILSDLLRQPYKMNGDDCIISGISNNSRLVIPGDVFFAVPGYVTDGAEYALDAVERGAVAVVSQKPLALPCPNVVVEDIRRALAIACRIFFDDPAQKMTMIGVTGTNGKTTTTYIVKQILDILGYRTGLIGTNQNMILDQSYETANTTPDCVQLGALLSKMVAEGVEYCIMEVSSHALILDRVYGITFDVAAFTNLTTEHLDFHQNMEQYAAAKALLFQQSKKAVINSDCHYGNYMYDHCQCPAILYGINQSEQHPEIQMVRPDSYKLYPDKIIFSLPDCNGEFTLGIPGEFSLYNALCSISILQSLGMDINIVREAFSRVKGVKGRCEVVDTNALAGVTLDYSIIIDYAHTPDGMENILKAMKASATGRIITLFGAGGDRDKRKRTPMGVVAGKYSDVVIVTSDNPRTEDPLSIISSIVEGLQDSQPYICPDRTNAIALAMEMARPNDVVLLLGKGHETYQIIGKKKYPMDEREIIRSMLIIEN